ncbi:methyltransferase family protein [Texcoconibacillus texcoconensis]|uniref:Protein-S-isoprenylcysteine O-methyltransferase Ste14 n=1 Tax=Texcoconibacillus texcoconensis TaxID=1095777 RepID=A0A840QLY5_9BACI|nr:isoprenylcysteine carboxylmethyltransferase family protein [Texcoconibacillus texcoconensis]MBB5172389.1 protein-S-isoprenylcysteine O-methyltransferase Ste14 [Texcoconibacillus texcoconensis]
MGNKKQASLFSHVVAILFLPFNVTVVIPALLLFFFSNEVSWGLDMPISVGVISLGSLLLLFGLMLVVLTVRQFATRGKGTLAPWNPPQKLVVSGPYQYTRNPMISGVSFILLGEVIIFGSWALLIWFVYFTVVNYTYFIVKEEPHLEKKFGEDYAEYKQNVPRLIPRRKPWQTEEK